MNKLDGIQAERYVITIVGLGNSSSDEEVIFIPQYLLHIHQDGRLDKVNDLREQTLSKQSWESMSRAIQVRRITSKEEKDSPITSKGEQDSPRDLFQIALKEHKKSITQIQIPKEAVERFLKLFKCSLSITQGMPKEKVLKIQQDIQNTIRDYNLFGQAPMEEGKQK